MSYHHNNIYSCYSFIVTDLNMLQLMVTDYSILNFIRYKNKQKTVNCKRVTCFIKKFKNSLYNYFELLE